MLSKIFKWYHDAPVDGKIVGAKAETAQYAGHGDILYTKHVSPADIIPGQSYVQFAKTFYHNLMTSVDPSDRSALQGWGKVMGLTPQKSGPSNGSHKVDVDVNGQIVTFDITNIKKSIPKPLLGSPKNG